MLAAFAAPSSQAAVVTQTRADPADPSVASDDADLRQASWSVDTASGTTTLEVRLRATGAAGQLVTAWLDTNGDDSSDLYVRFDRTALTMADVTVATPAGASPPCQDVAGGTQLVGATVPVADALSLINTLPGMALDPHSG